jgi:hypothetical protein
LLITIDGLFRLKKENVRVFSKELLPFFIHEIDRGD